MQNLIECPGVLQFRQMLAHGGNEAGKATTVGDDGEECILDSRDKRESWMGNKLGNVR